MTLSDGSMLAIALVLGSCNNGEEAKKQAADQDAKIQSLVDTKLSGLQDQVNTECAARIDSLAQVKYDEWKEEHAKHHGAGGGTKTKPKETTKETPKDPKANKMNGQQTTTTDEKKAKMNGQQPTNNTDAKKNKMGGNK